MCPGFGARAQKVLERLSLDGLVRQAPGAKACHYGAVRAPQRGRVRVAGRVQAVAFGQLRWSPCSSHASLNVVPQRPDHAPIPPSAWKGRSRNFVLRAFSEVRRARLGAVGVPHAGGGEDFRVHQARSEADRMYRRHY